MQQLNKSYLIQRSSSHLSTRGNYGLFLKLQGKGKGFVPRHVTVYSMIPSDTSRLTSTDILDFRLWR
jgi:hypothetical protein